MLNLVDTKLIIVCLGVGGGHAILRVRFFYVKMFFEMCRTHMEEDLAKVTSGVSSGGLRVLEHPPQL